MDEMRRSSEYKSIAEQISEVVLSRPKQSWKMAFVIALLLFALLLFAVTVLMVVGVGIWGVNIPVAWGFAITNFVWWIGIGHAGTFISAFLLLMHQPWRNTINRFAEAMTIFSVLCAGMFPLLHLGRPWLFFYLLPYPNHMALWPQWRSALVWDVFAVATYFFVSLIFWYLGMLPDLAILRDKAKTVLARKLYAIASLGWLGSASHWRRYETAYTILAGLAAPLVISVHSVVSLDFASAQVPGWHSTFFPPYFVAGAIFSGFAMVLTLAIPLRTVYGLENLITARHLENAAKLLLTTGLIVDYSYLTEYFIAWYAGDEYETAILIDRFIGHYRLQWWLVLLFNVGAPLLLWFRKIRMSPASLLVISLAINTGMWLERYIIIVQSLHRGFMPSSWHIFSGTIWDFATLAGSFGLFLIAFLIFLRFLPAIAISETQKQVHEQNRKTKETQ